MSKTTLLVLVASGVLTFSSGSWAASSTNAAGGQAPMMNSNDPASNTTMQNGTMQQPMPTTPSANGGTLKDSAEATKQKMMMQQNTGQ